MATKLENVLEAIGQAIYEHNLRPETDPEVHRYLDMAKEAYVVVQWPESQELMEEEWFDEEAILDVEGKFGSSAYLVPISRLIEIEN